MTRRESALVRHAKRKAIALYEEQTELTIQMNGVVLARMSIAQLRWLNTVAGLGPRLVYNLNPLGAPASVIEMEEKSGVWEALPTFAL